MHTGFHSKRTWVSILYGGWTLIGANVLLSAAPDNSELAQLKAFIQQPASVDRIIFDRFPPGKNDPTTATRLEGTCDWPRFFLKSIFPNRQELEQGASDSVPWSYHISGIEALELYESFPAEIEKLVRMTGGMVPGEEKLREVLNCGIFLLKPASLSWDGDDFSAIVNGNIPITGYLTNFNSRGLPSIIYYSFPGGQPKYKINLAYNGSNVPSFFPYVIERTMLSSQQPATKNLSRHIVHELLISTNPLNSARFDPIALHSNATRLYHTNKTWTGFRGTNQISVVANDKAPKNFVKKLLVVFLVVTTCFYVFMRYRKGK